MTAMPLPPDPPPWQPDPMRQKRAAYRLARPSGHYELVADSAELLEVAEPFPIKLSLSEITP